MARRSILLMLLFVSASASGCAPSDEVDPRPAIVAAGVFSPRRIEVGNDAVVALGQLLFFDRELSGNRNIACASCHLPELNAGDRRTISVGQDDERLSRNVLEPFNRSFATSFFWDGRLSIEDGVITSPRPVPEGIHTLLEEQALLPLLDRAEMRGHEGDVAAVGENELAIIPDDQPEAVWEAIVARLLALEGYRDPFTAAFPKIPFEEITIVEVVVAISAFERHLWELTDTAFDDYLGSVSEPGDDGALAELERRGAALFFGEARCGDCHDGPLLGGTQFHNIGVPQIGIDEGRGDVTGDPQDRFAFRTPPLRNVALTSPYMHDGAFASLEEAVRHHLDPERSLRSYTGAELPADLRDELRRDEETVSAILATLSPQLRATRALGDDEVFQLVAFLGALSSRTEQVLPPGAGIPMSVPSGLPIDMLELSIDP